MKPLTRQEALALTFECPGAAKWRPGVSHGKFQTYAKVLKFPFKMLPKLTKIDPWSPPGPLWGAKNAKNETLDQTGSFCTHF